MSITWVEVESFLHRPPADVLWSVLDGHGIPARVRGDDPQGFVPLGRVRLEVPADRAEEARKVLAPGVDDDVAST